MTAPIKSTPAAKEGEIPIPAEHVGRALALDLETRRTFVLREFYQLRASRAIQKAWFPGKAVRAYLQAAEAYDNHTRSTRALWEFLHAILPDTLVGQWNLDTTRMVVTQKQNHHPLAALLGQQQ